MSNLNYDMKYADDILNGRIDDTFGFIYSRTNENLTRLFSHLDISAKDVYTILSSSDILFSSYTSKAATVDCFDINPISYRYYHLRKWLLQYGLIDADGQSIRELAYIVNHHLPSDSKDEQESATFWKDYLSKIDNIHFYSNILFEYIEQPAVPYEKNLRELSQKLSTVEPRFDLHDICSKINPISDKKYDTIFMSNILDYNREPQKMQLACENLLSLLKNKGIVLCTHMPQYSLLEEEKNIFSRHFNYEELFVDQTEKQDVLYYQYTKK